jgi:PAS domain S-box-containing protein
MIVILIGLSRLHESEPRASLWPSLGEVIVYVLGTLMVIATGAAGQYRRRLQAITKEHAQKLQVHSRALDRAHIIFRDLDGNISEWSDGIQSLFGWSREEAIGRSIHDLLKSKFLDDPTSIRDELLRTGEWQGEILQQHKNGSVLNIASHWILYRDATGKPSGVAEVCNDVTDLRRAEAAVRDADRRKEEFLATLAHELRNPLAPISNSLQIMRMSDELGPSLQRVRDIMEQQTGHMIRLVDDLLDVSRVTRGKITLKKERVLLAELVANAVETLRNQLVQSRIELSISLPSEPLFLHVDPVRLTQVVSNLLGNAAKYTEPGGHIWLTAVCQEATLILSVRDTGAGLPPEMLDDIFEMFTQVDRTLTRAAGGLGIGLTLVKNLVELHGGTVSADSEGQGLGSCFTVRLPIEGSLNAGRGGSSFGDKPTTLPIQRRILVVDDTRPAGYVLCKLLEKLGQTVKFAGDGNEALEVMAAYRPDVVISDIAMPLMDGYELAGRIRQDSRFRDVVLVALTGFGQTSDREKALAAGFDRHLVKPADVELLRELLTNLSRERDMAAQRGADNRPVTNS